MLFSFLVASPSWNLSTARFYMNLLTSPTIDLADACTLVGALMLSCRRWFDVNKFLTIVHVYCRAADNQLRQRALVAWCFSLAEQPMSLYGGCKAELTRLLEEEEVRNDVLELQMQVFLCMRTEEDNQLIQRDIMPTLLKNQNLQITRLGIVEKDDNNLQDILDPGAAERNMEELEKTIRKMENMQKAGTDVFFGGFRLMKRFSFFYTLSNWFVPFYMDHPDIADVVKEGYGLFHSADTLQPVDVDNILTAKAHHKRGIGSHLLQTILNLGKSPRHHTVVARGVIDMGIMIVGKKIKHLVEVDEVNLIVSFQN